MSRKKFLASSLLCFAVFLSCVTVLSTFAEVVFQKTYGGTSFDEGKAVEQTHDGGYLIAGTTWSFGIGKINVYGIRTDSIGDILWMNTYGDDVYNWGYSARLTPEGSFVIAGITYSQGDSNDAYLVGTDLSGNVIWTRRHDNSRYDHVYSLDTTQSGGQVVTGRGGGGLHILCTDSLGNSLWWKSHYCGGEGTGWSIRQTSGGGYVVCGQKRWDYRDDSVNVLLLKTDALGNVEWAATYGGDRADYGYSVEQTQDGGYIITGATRSFGAGDYDVYLVRTDSLGNVLWEEAYGGSKVDVGFSVCLTGDGGYVVAGATESFGMGVRDVYLLKTDSTGNLEWSRIYGGEWTDEAYSVQETRDGGFVLVGTRTSSLSAQDVYLIKTDQYGRTQPCDPIQPWEPRTQGYWRRQCKHNPHEDICAYMDSVHTLANLFDAFDCDSICDLMNVNLPENNMCRKAKRQFMALLLNVASGKLAVCNCLEDGREVGDVIAEIDSLLSGDPDFHTCEYAKTLADDLNNGIGIVSCDTTWTQAPPKAVQPPSISVTPNPFSKSTAIEYEVKSPGRVRLEIYDKAGRLVRSLVDAEQTIGPHRVKWDGFDGSERQVPAGIYFTRLQTCVDVCSGKLILLR